MDFEPSEEYIGLSVPVAFQNPAPVTLFGLALFLYFLSFGLYLGMKRKRSIKKYQSPKKSLKDVEDDKLRRRLIKKCQSPKKSLKDVENARLVSSPNARGNDHISIFNFTQFLKCHPLILRRLVQFEEEEDEHIEPNVVYAGENIHLSNDENVIFAREKRHLSSYSRSTSSKGTSQQEHIAQSSSIQNEVHSHSLSDADFLNNEEVNGVAISRKKWNTTWFVIVVDEQGVEKSMHLKVKDAFSLHHSRKRVLIEWNGSGQPIGESGGLLGGVLGLIASNFNNFPIMYKTWHKVPLQYKDAVFENTIKKIFVVNDDEHKKYILSNLGNKWKNDRCKLFNEHYKSELGWDANVNLNPIGIPKDHWAAFLEYRLSPKTQELCEKNAINRQQLKIPHTLGSKTLARKRHELEVKTGRQFSRGEMFSITHKKKDGTFVNEEAQQKNEDLQKEIGEGASENEAYVKVFGKENSSYVRGMGFGVRPSQMIGSLSRSRESMQSTTTSGPSRTEYQNLKLQVQLLQEQVNFLVNYQKGQLPPGFSTEVADFESPTHTRPYSSASHEPKQHRPSNV
ncbi:hypothetical protein Ahy_A06g028664 [Arachis hypogaea]|uniref:Uncharacterized protein n=1 Tax=Arachis hypogaea TaxID=3818 RepID=A0A445CRC7_ARAHY|nr:hypothetical protein Ahy_A06g028664 [Arachis hypogaea]